MQSTVLISIVLLLTWGTMAAEARGNSLPGEQNAAANDENEKDILARVNGEPLYVEDVASVLGEIHANVEAKDRSDFDLDAMLFRLINDTLFAQEARILGFDEDEVLRRKVAALKERLATNRLRYEKILSKIELDPEAVERVYNEGFRTATLRIATRKDKAEAEIMRREIDEGVDIETMARERSEDPYAGRGGLMHEVAYFDLPQAIAEQAFSMSPGDIAGPVATGLGWTVFRVEALQPADPEKFDSRKGEVRDVLRFRQDEALRSRLLERLRETYDVEVDEDAYAAVGVQVMSDGRLVPEIDDPDAVVVEAGGREITAAAFGRALADRWLGISNPDVALAIKPILLDRLTVDELMTAEAYRLGYDRLPEVERRASALETRLLVKRYMEEVIAPQVQVDRETIEAYYADHRDEFKKPPLLFVSQMTLGSSEEAARMIELLHQGTEFAWLARKNSTDGYAQAGGSVGWMKANEGMTGFQQDLATAKEGDIFGPKGADVDWRIVQVSAMEDQGYYSFEEVSGNVRKRVEEREFFALIDRYVERLRERSEIWIDQEALASLQLSAEPKQESSGHAENGHGGV
ncbi:MAG: peptidyl-prolyl cis-trans isomerase [Acidobacteriota bacterium]